MPGIVAGIIAVVVGAVVGVGGGVVLTSSQGGGSYPAQNEAPITVYGSN